MHIILIRLCFQIPQAQSLKDKRRQIKSLKDRLSNRFNLSVAEIGELESWHNAEIGICMISRDKSYLDKQFNLIESVVLDYVELELTGIHREWL